MSSSSIEYEGVASPVRERERLGRGEGRVGSKGGELGAEFGLGGSAARLPGLWRRVESATGAKVTSILAESVAPRNNVRRYK